MIIITVINQKGGVAKTTTVNSIGAGLYKAGQKVLYVDMDPQGNLTYSFDVKGERNIVDVLLNNVPAKDAAVKSNQGDIIVSCSKLANAVSVLEDQKDGINKLKKALAPLDGIYDVVLVDTPPALSQLTLNALTASNYVIIVAQSDIYSLQGVGDLMSTIEAVKQNTNPDIVVDGILITRYNSRANLNKKIVEMFEETAAKIGLKVYDTKIRECVALRECQAFKQDIFSYAPKSNGAKDYQSLIKEMFE